MLGEIYILPNSKTGVNDMREYQYVTTNDCCASNEVDRPVSQREDGAQIKCRTYGTVTIPTGTEVGTAFPLVNLNVDTHGYKKPFNQIG